MSAVKNSKPAVWIGHVGMYSPDIAASKQFMLQIGMREIFSNNSVAVLEMRGGTHLVITDEKDSGIIRGSFDLMIDDIEVARNQLLELGYQPGEIERGKIHDSFEIEEPGGTVLLFNSSHVGDLPV